MEYEGWISRLHRALKPLLNTRLGSEARIWRDSRLINGHILSKEVIDQLRQSAVMLSIVSPCYLRSDWCKLEVKEFRDHAENTGEPQSELRNPTGLRTNRRVSWLLP